MMQPASKKVNEMKPSYGVIVGRFQVHELTDGHMELLRQVRVRHPRVIILVGCTPAGPTKRNPLDFVVRRRMIEAKFPEFIVVPIMDKKTDELWSQEVDARIADVIGAVPADVVLYGGRDSFIPYYNGIHEPHELELSNPISPSGTEVREKLTNTVMESADFRAGVIYAMHQMYPRTIPTVDVAVLHCNGDKTEVLLGRKKNEKGLRFIGGYAEPGSDRYELDGAREVMEEASREIGNFEYISSQKIDDWRYTNETDKIKTLFFMATANSLDIKAGDDIEHVEWVDIRKIKHTHFEQEHQVLVEALITNLQKKGILQ